MKCIGKQKISALAGALFFLILLSGCRTESKMTMKEYEENHFNTSLYEGTLISEELCVSAEDVGMDGFSCTDNLYSSALFDLNQQKVLYSFDLHERNYPASITKIMTALLALEHGNLEDEITISSTADASNFSIYASVCGIKEGEVWTLEDLLNALMLASGNDVARAIAEYIGGSEEAFVDMMNQKARELSAVNTHFMNPHGLHDEQHYSTAYDLYLIFNECVKNPHFVEIIGRESYTAHFKAADGSAKEVTYKPTNLYASGYADKPDNVTLIGGKTGTTDDLKRCLILFSKDAEENPYISVILSADDKPTLYKRMTSLIEAIPVS